MPVWRLQGHTARVTKVAFNPKNDTFITAAQVGRHDSSIWCGVLLRLMHLFF